MLTRPWPIWCQFGPTCFWLALDLPQLKSVHFNSFISYHLPILIAFVRWAGLAYDWLALDLAPTQVNTFWFIYFLHFGSFIYDHLRILLHLRGEQASHMMSIRSDLFLTRPWLGPTQVGTFWFIYLWSLTNLIAFARWASLPWESEDLTHASWYPHICVLQLVAAWSTSSHR